MSAANLVAIAEAEKPLGGRYVLGVSLGRGASGESFSATTDSGAACVVKLFHPGERPGAEAIAEFRRLEALAHPSVVRVRDVGRAPDGRLYLVTDRVAGPPVGSIAAIDDEAERRRAFERAARELADGLAHLHGRGIIHGDVSPANVRLAADGRAVLIDFGLAGPPQEHAAGGARGTLGYAAPEALTGSRTAAGDLFALGATLFEAWTGAPPFGRGLPAVQRMLGGPAPPLAAVRAGLGPAWDDIVARLLAADARERPPSARALLRDIGRASAGAETPTELDLGVPHPEGDPLQGLVVGRAAEREALRSAIDRLAERAADLPAAIAIVGPPGSGRRTLIDSVARDVMVATAAGILPPLEILRGDLQELGRLLALEPAAAAEADEARAAERRLAALSKALEARAQARGQPVCLILDESPASQTFVTFCAGATPSGRVLVIAPARAPIDRAFVENVPLGPLTAQDLDLLLARAAGAPVPDGAGARLAAASGGLAAAAAVLARRMVADLREGRGAALHGEPAADLDALLREGLAALPPGARRLVARLALGLDEAPRRDIDHDRAAAWAAGWLTGVAATGDLPSDGHRRVALAALASPELADLARRALAELPETDPRRADALAALDRRSEAAALVRRAAGGALAAREHIQAALLLERARTLDPTGLTLDEELALATGLGMLARYDGAAAGLVRAEALAHGPLDGARLAERRAWLLVRTGDLGAARRELERALGTSGSAQAVPALRARLGRLLVTTGRFGEALTALSPLLDAGGAGRDALALETAVLAHAYLGDGERARAGLAVLSQAPDAPPARLAYLAALIDHLSGQTEGAVAGYRRAYELSAAQGDVHTLAAVALNLGALLADQGVYGEALEATERAVRELGRLGATTELGTALANAANLLVQLGDLPAARRALARARSEGARRGVPAVDALVSFVEGDLARREGQLDGAVERYRAAAALFAGVGQPHRARSAVLAAAETLALAGRAGDGAQVEREAGPPEPGAAAADEAESIQVRARLALAGGNIHEPLPEVASRADAAAARARAENRRPAAFRLAVLAARLHERAGIASRARESLTVARTIFEEVRMATPEHHRPGLDADPDVRFLSGAGSGAGGGGDASLVARAAETEARLRRLLRINKRLNSELRLPRLLEMIVDTVIELTDAERGFLLLEDDSGELNVKVARNIDQRTLETAEFELSRSIARQAATGGEPIVTIDAAGDARFRQVLSVSDLHLRSILAVPLSIKGRAAGTIYVDHRLRKGAFDQDDVRLVLDFAEQAAIAIENARLLAELRRRERQVEALNRRLEIELAARREELSGMKQELRENREALAIRYDYRNIVGRTPRMQELFRLLDRLTDTTLPVVIQGESGTGKELVARAIHFNGPRKTQPFVSENCAAIPETLLESTLFGYARGAFTGADRDTRGLFEVADGGTLFLDEIGEMSPAMQGKLLRVLQDGEFRRVGGERTRKVDVRILAATNRNLGRMVEEGKFRQDLYFRLNVARIMLPPLRERREDIPLIVTHFLAKRAATDGRPAPKPLDPVALGRLCAYRWPGNVRELENEITRADALSAERITAADLSPQVSSAGDPGSVPATDDPDSLLVRPRVERTERALIREALGRCGNNQTKAAELLGLSRFGLQKKLKRYRMG